MVVDILLRVSGIETVVHTGLVVECHVLCTTNILRELLGHVEASVGVGLDLQTVNLTALGGDQDSTLGTFGTIEHHSLCTLQEGDLLDLGRQHVVRRTLHTIDDHERHVPVVIIIKTVVVHTPKVVAVPSANKGIHVFQATRHVILLLQLFHVDISHASEKLVGILVAERYMHFLFCHDRITVFCSLCVDCQRRYSNRG